MNSDEKDYIISKSDRILFLGNAIGIILMALVTANKYDDK